MLSVVVDEQEFRDWGECCDGRENLPLMQSNNRLQSPSPTENEGGGRDEWLKDRLSEEM